MGQDDSIQSTATILDLPESMRLEAVDDPVTPYEVLLLLTRDRSCDVRFALAENHNVPNQVLIELTSDENPYIAVRATRTLERLQKCQTHQTKTLPCFKPIQTKRISSA